MDDDHDELPDWVKNWQSPYKGGYRPPLPTDSDDDGLDLTKDTPQPLTQPQQLAIIGEPSHPLPVQPDISSQPELPTQQPQTAQQANDIQIQGTQGRVNKATEEVENDGDDDDDDDEALVSRVRRKAAAAAGSRARRSLGNAVDGDATPKPTVKRGRGKSKVIEDSPATQQPASQRKDIGESSSQQPPQQEQSDVKKEASDAHIVEVNGMKTSGRSKGRSQKQAAAKGRRLSQIEEIEILDSQQANDTQQDAPSLKHEAGQQQKQQIKQDQDGDVIMATQQASQQVADNAGKAGRRAAVALPPGAELPIMLPERLLNNKALVELPGSNTAGHAQEDAVDLAGDAGAVGRVIVTNACAKNGAGAVLTLDLKGVLFNSKVLPLQTTAMVLNIQPGEARVESLFNDFIQLDVQQGGDWGWEEEGPGGLAALMGDSDDDDHYGGGGEGSDGEGGPGKKKKMKKSTKKATAGVGGGGVGKGRGSKVGGKGGKAGGGKGAGKSKKTGIKVKGGVSKVKKSGASKKGGAAKGTKGKK